MRGAHLFILHHSLARSRLWSCCERRHNFGVNHGLLRGAPTPPKPPVTLVILACDIARWNIVIPRIVRSWMVKSSLVGMLYTIESIPIANSMFDDR